MNTSKIQNLLKFLVSRYQFPLMNDDSNILFESNFIQNWN